MEKSSSNENNQPRDILRSTETENGAEDIEAWRDKVIEQIIEIRDGGLTNMFNVRNVLELAMVYDFSELVDFISSNQRGYGSFILTGNREEIV